MDVDKGFKSQIRNKMSRSNRGRRIFKCRKRNRELSEIRKRERRKITY
jgi:hypothetical protein